MPGYVESQMCRDMPGPKPFLWSAEKAARNRSSAAWHEQPRISFPFPLNLGTWVLSVLRPGDFGADFASVELRWIAFSGLQWLPLAAGRVCSLLVEMLLLPQPQWVWKRGWGAGAIHAGLWLVLVAVELLVWRRPVFAALNVLALELLIILVSRVKFHTLREPFIVQDFDYFIDVIRHPWLYIPFLGFARALMAAVAFALSIWAAMVFESSLLHVVSAEAFLVGTGVLALGGTLLLWLGGSQRPSLTWNPSDDLVRLGLAASLWHYGVAERRSRNEALPDSLFASPPPAVDPAATTVVVGAKRVFLRPTPPVCRHSLEVLQQFDNCALKPCLTET